MSTTIALHTLGCKVNTYDTEAIWQLFKNRGYTQVDFHDHADVYVINTCTVTDTGDKKSRQVIRRAIRQNQHATVVVTGCYAQMAPDEILQIDGVDLVIGTQQRDRIVDLVEEVQETQSPIKFVSSVRSQREFEELDVPDFQDRTRAFLKIQEGCNNFCTFCIIPYSRGFIRSRKPENVITQARNLVEGGFREIVLSGIHTGGYGDDLDEYTLADLLVELEAVEGLERIRISSIEASEIDDKMIEVLTRSKKICHHLHIPLQAGSNSVLDRMNRKYTVEDFATKLVQLRQALPELAITSDVIVGFPEESDENFMETYHFVKDQGFAELHVFPYSKRKGTPAAKYIDQVPDAVKEKRVAKLVELSGELRETYSRQFIGREVDVIPEEINEEGLLVGYSDNYIRVAFRGHPDMIGEICTVQLDEAGPQISKGTMVTQRTFKLLSGNNLQENDFVEILM